MDRSLSGTRSADTRRTGVALLIVGVAVAGGLVALLSSRSDGDSPARPAPTPAAPANAYFVARTGCNDARTAAEAHQLGTPWCSPAHAIQSVPPGSTVILGPGSYPRIELKIRAVPAGPTPVTLRGQRGEAAPEVAGASLEKVRGLVVSGLRFTRNVGISRSAQIRIERNAFAASTLYVKASNDIKIVGNSLRHLRGASRAIFVQGGGMSRPTTNLVIQGNRIDDTDHDAIGVYNGYRNVQIIGNRVSNVHQDVDGNGGYHADGIQLTGGDGLLVKGNVLSNVTHGMILKDGPPTTNARIIGNLVTDSGGAGLQVFNAPGILIQQNTFWRTKAGLTLGNARNVAGTTSATLVRNVFDIFPASNRASVKTARSNVIRSGTRVGRPVYVGTPRFEDAKQGDFKLDPKKQGARIPSGAQVLGAQLAVR